MPLLFAFLALLAPRIMIVLLFAFTTWFDGLFTWSLWPILGFLVLPTSLLWYTVVVNWLGGGVVAVGHYRADHRADNRRLAGA